MKILIVRHGESERNAKINENLDLGLTKKGGEQAKYLGRTLKKQKIDIDYIYTSNLKRSKETAEIISKIMEVPIEKNFGELNEYPGEYLRRRFKNLFNKRLKKLKKLLKEIIKDRQEEKTILIVAHGITNKIIMGYLMEFPLRKNLLRFSQNNTGLSVLEWKEKYQNWGLRFLNDINHLPKDLK